MFLAENTDKNNMRWYLSLSLSLFLGRGPDGFVSKNSWDMGGNISWTDPCPTAGFTVRVNLILSNTFVLTLHAQQLAPTSYSRRHQLKNGILFRVFVQIIALRDFEARNLVVDDDLLLVQFPVEEVVHTSVVRHLRGNGSEDGERPSSSIT